MLDPVTFVNNNIVNCYVKHLIKNYPCPNNFICLNSLLIIIFERDGHLNNVNLRMDEQSMTFVLINVTKTHWQAMFIVIEEDERKETDFFFDFHLRSFDPLNNNHINCIAVQAIK